MVINFKKFDAKEYIRTYGNSWSNNHIMFMCGDDVVRIGYLYEDYHGNGHTTYYFCTGGNGTKYNVDSCRYADIKIEVE